MRQRSVVILALVGLFSTGMVQAQDHIHDGTQKYSPGPAGYKSDKGITRYELATALFQLINHIDAAAKQPARSEREVKPGRKSVVNPDPKKVRLYSDVPKDHWAKASLAGLQARGIALVSGSQFQGDKSMTGDEVASWVDGLAGWTEGRAPKAKYLKDLVQMGYLPKTSPLLKKSTKPVSAREAAQVITQMISHAHEKITTISPDSKYAG